MLTLNFIVTSFSYKQIILNKNIRHLSNIIQEYEVDYLIMSSIKSPQPQNLNEINAKFLTYMATYCCPFNINSYVYTLCITMP